MKVTVVPPFDFAQSLESLSGFAPCAGDHYCERERLVTGGFVEELPFVAHVTAQNGEPERLSVDVRWIDDPGEEAAVAEWLSAFLSLDDDLTALYEAARDDPPFERIVQGLRGFHHVRFPTPFEAACWAALSQRTPMSLAKQQKQALVEVCGRIVEDGDQEISLFPTPKMVRAAEPAVRETIGNERKAKTLLGAAELFADEPLGELTDEVLLTRLADIWGFGEWSSEFVFLRGFGRLTRVPSTERRLRKAVADVYELDGAEASDSDLAQLSERYAPMKGYWAYYVRAWAFRREVDTAPIAN